MAKKLHILTEDINFTDQSCEIKIAIKALENNLNRAQVALDTMVKEHMVPFMPMEMGMLIDLSVTQSNAWAGTGKVCAAIVNQRVPYGRFLYEGKVMVGVESGSPWARKGEKKIVTSRPLTYSHAANPQATDHWFEKAYDKHHKNWERVVSRILSTGR